MNLLNIKKQDPLITFTVIAALIFLTDFLLNNKPTLTITEDDRRAIISQASELYGRPLNSTEIDAAINEYINNKLLYNDAMRMGLEKDRTLEAALIRKYQAVLFSSLPESQEDAIRHYYETHTQDYMTEASVDADVIQFMPGQPIPNDITSILNNTDSTIQTIIDSAGGHFATYNKMSEQEMKARLGDDIFTTLQKTEKNQWAGPFTTTRGVFYIRQHAFYAGQLRPFEEVKSYAADGELKMRKAAVIQEKIEELKKQTIIKLPTP